MKLKLDHLNFGNFLRCARVFVPRANKAKCKVCERLKSKVNMVHLPTYGWFCSERHAKRYWDKAIQQH